MNLLKSFESFFSKAEEIQFVEELVIKAKYRQKSGELRVDMSLGAQHFSYTAENVSDLKKLGQLNSLIFLKLA
jgi:hypothetical protein